MTQEPFSWSEGNRLVGELGREDHLAARIKSERIAREWSQSELAREMAKVGCPIPQTAISKIEKPQSGGRRAIAVEEALGFAKVFAIPFGELLLPDDQLISISEMRLLGAAEAALGARSRAEDQYRGIVNDVAATAFKDGTFRSRLNDQRNVLSSEGDQGSVKLQVPAGWLNFLKDVFEVIEHLTDRSPKRASNKGK